MREAIESRPRVAAALPLSESRLLLGLSRTACTSWSSSRIKAEFQRSGHPFQTFMARNFYGQQCFTMWMSIRFSFISKVRSDECKKSSRNTP
jgi:hypothetical protein